MANQSFDAVVVGASLAGCTAAILLAREGAKVALVERYDQPQHHKQLCTHYIQASALPTLRRLGLDRLIEKAGGVRNPIEGHSPAGWVGFHLGNREDGTPQHGYNIRRVTLDPIIRGLASETPGVTPLFGAAAKSLVMESGRVAGVRMGGRREGTTLLARLVVAADGRNSALATMVGARTKRSPNRRFGILAPMRGVDLQRGQISQFWITGPEVAYVFPNDDQVTVVGWIALQEQLDQVGDQPFETLKQRVRAFPDAPRFQRAEPADETLVVKDFPNVWRPPVAAGMALVGDALTSVDYLWGVGCGWAFQTGAWLADAVATELKSAGDLRAALKRYERQCAALAGHRFLINDFARRRSINMIERLLFAAAAKDVRMARHLNRFAARIDGPAAFLSPAALFRALWVNLRQPAATAAGTRVGYPWTDTAADVPAPTH